MLFLTTKMYITFQEGDLLDHRDIYKSKVSGALALLEIHIFIPRPTIITDLLFVV
jgi:hypothetical protein